MPNPDRLVKLALAALFALGCAAAGVGLAGLRRYAVLEKGAGR